jgi:hypothetical protein
MFKKPGSGLTNCLKRTAMILRRPKRLGIALVAVAMIAGPAWGAAAQPVLQNQVASYRWAAPERGAGLVAIEDLVNGKSFLNPGDKPPTWWRVKLKDGGTVSNTDLPCTVADREGSLTFTWTGDVRVVVTARIDETLLRARIRIDAVKEGVGLRDVVFPIVDGIRPLTQDAADDRVLHARRTGYTGPSPLTTAEPINWRYNIEYNMQFAALLGGGQGLYFGDHDPTAAWKEISWTPNVDAQTLTFSVSHPVLNWGAPEPVRHYESPGDCVLGPFQGDWYDAGRMYRKWAVTAPWSAKGPMHARDDYPKWFLNTNYWVGGQLGDYEDQQREFVKLDLFDFPITITHDYGYYAQPYQHDLDPEYFPPRPGSVNYQRVLGELRDRGARVLPYVMGWMWNAASEDYQLRGAKEKGAMRGEDGQSLLWSELSPGEENIGMCPASKIWRDKLTEVSVEFVRRYRTGGVYFDYFSVHMNDCHNPDHGHALGGGDYWSRGMNGLYKQVRETVHKIDPEAMFCGEDPAEFCNDVLDAHYTSAYPYDAPVWQVVYHDYIQLFGGMHWMEDRPLPVGRQWLSGHMNHLPGGYGHAETDTRPETVQWLRNLLRCHHEFARPYLGYGEMLRPPTVSGDLPTLTMQGGDGPFSARAVEGTAWRAPDGSVGIFFFNYEDQPHQFTWKTDVAELAGFDASKQLQMTQWTAERGATPLKQTNGGIVGDTVDIQPRGLIALKLEVVE